MKQLSEKLKKQVYVLYLVYSSDKVQWYKKLFILLILLYALSPIDLIPDFIPIIGLLDDLVLVPLGILLAMKMIPKEIWDECRLSAEHEVLVDKKFGLIGAAVIILIWALLILAVVLKYFT